VSWLLSLLIAAVSGVLGLVGAGFIGNLCVEWYRISGREGAAGYFVVAIALLGGLLGFVIGPVAVRLVAAGGTSRSGTRRAMCRGGTGTDARRSCSLSCSWSRMTSVILEALDGSARPETP
jgi:hypothetical protein